MPVAAENKRRSGSYETDFGTLFNTSGTFEHMDIGGFGGSVPGGPVLPRRFKMRQLHGVNAAGTRRVSIPVATVDQAGSYIQAGAFTWDGEQFTVTGYTGEKFTQGPPSI